MGKLRIYFSKRPLGQRIVSVLTFLLFEATKFLEVRQKLHENVENQIFSGISVNF